MADPDPATNAQLLTDGMDAVTATAGVPIIADSKFMAAYSMIEPEAVYHQENDQNELDAMFNVAHMAPEEMWRARLGEHHSKWPTPDWV